MSEEILLLAKNSWVLLLLMLLFFSTTGRYNFFLKNTKVDHWNLFLSRGTRHATTKSSIVETENEKYGVLLIANYWCTYTKLCSTYLPGYVFYLCSKKFRVFYGILFFKEIWQIEALGWCILITFEWIIM